MASRLIFTMLLAFKLLLSVSVTPIASQSSGRISTSQSLTATINRSSWLSPKRDFAFGFHPYPSNENFFLLAIWYAKIPDTIVWYPVDINNGNPVPKGSTVTLTSYSGLILNDPSGNTIWNTTTQFSGPGFISYGFLNDTGNLVLKTESDEVLWQSFDHPADTLLPSQIIKSNMDIYSRLSEANFTKGRFLMSLRTDGRLILTTADQDSEYKYDDNYYDTSITSTSQLSSSGPQLVYDISGSMYILLGNGSRVSLTPDDFVSTSENYLRATLNFDGVLIWYHHPRNFTQKNDVWYTAQLIPDDICSSNIGVGSGICGYNSICRLSNDKRPICTCPESYSLIEPESNTTFGNCEPDFRLDYCHKYEQESGKVAKLVQLQGVDWPQQDYAARTCTEDDCKSYCVSDCFCAAAIYERSSNTCWKKKLPLTNGRNDSSVTRIAWLKVGSSNYSISPASLLPSLRKKKRLITLFTTLLGVSTSVNLIFLCVIGLAAYPICFKRKFRRLDRDHNIDTLREYSIVNCFSYQDLHDATQGFKEEIGRGAFGVVYKGVLKSAGPPIFVAVKKLDRLTENADKEFKTEVNVIGQTHHKNLVRFVGFCNEGIQRLLVYEYMSNGNLANYLFGETRPNWMSRIQIAQGIAKGLSYLHEECSFQIIHCDIKPENVLLDDYHNARIADFGLTKILGLNQTHTNTMIRGTKGYVAPEWFRNKPVTVKIDVYSFGILLLEIICCRRSVSLDLDDERAILTDWALDCYQANALDTLVKDDEEALDDSPRMKRYVLVALWCIQEDSKLRPTMTRVIQMLEGVAQVPNPPYASSFAIITRP